MAGEESYCKHITFKVNKGVRVRFHEDRWLGDKPLCLDYPQLYAMSDKKKPAD